MKQSWWQCFNSRLSYRIVRAAFVSIVAIEIVVFVPSYLLQEQQLLRQLENIAAEVFLGIHRPGQADSSNPGSSNSDSSNSDSSNSDPSKDLLTALKARAKPGTLIKGGLIYQVEADQSLQLVYAFGEVPEFEQDMIAKDKLASIKNRETERYDILWPSDNFNRQYVVAVRLNTEPISRIMLQYILRHVIVVLVVSITVTLVLLIVLQRILIQPILQLRDDLTVAGEVAGQENTPLFHTFYQTRQDELGDVAVAFCQMYHQIRQEIRDRKRAESALIDEKEKSERLLLNILPGAIARRLREDPGALASRFDEVTILFADIVGFTSVASQMKPLELLTQLNGMFSAFDKLADHYGLEKIKTIGDAYMVVGGMPTPQPDHVSAVLEMAIDMLEVIQEFKQPNGSSYQLRIGINTGPVIAGVIGKKKFSYDLWGDAVNIASRMESHGLVDHIQVTPMTYQKLQQSYVFEKRSGLIIKNVGKMDTYLYVARRATPVNPVQRSTQDVASS